MGTMARQVDLDALESHIDFMRAKLQQTSKALQNQNIVVPYDNGGGQCGIREHPAFAAYEKLLKEYRASVRDHDALTGSSGMSEREASSLDALRSIVRVHVS